jgi:hypothetical protein
VSTRLAHGSFARFPALVIAGPVPATPINGARPCHLIGVAGTSLDKPGHDLRRMGYTTSRNCDTASASTSQPNTMSASEVFSVMSWLMPPIEGMNIIVAGM